MASSLDGDRIREAGVEGIDGGIRASLATTAERRMFDSLVRAGRTSIQALRRIEEIRRKQDAGPSQSGR